MRFNKDDIIVSKKQNDVRYTVVEDYDQWKNVRCIVVGGKIPTWLDKSMFRLENEEPKTFKVGDVVLYSTTYDRSWYTVVDPGPIYSGIQKGTMQRVVVNNIYLTLDSSVEDRTERVPKTKAVEASPQLEFEWG